MSEIKPLDLEAIRKKLIRKYWKEQKYDEKQQRRDYTVEEILELFEQEAKNRIKSACEFYLKYKDNPELLVTDYPEFKRELAGKGVIFVFGGGEMLVVSQNEEKKDKYNEWLFKLAFKDIFKEGERK